VVDGDVLVRIEDLVKRFPVASDRLFGRSGREVQAVDGVSLDVRRGETLGLVGETGCGKSTLARCITRLYNLTSGRVSLRRRRHLDLCRGAVCARIGSDADDLPDPYGALNPRRRVGSIIGDPFAIHGIAAGVERRRRVQELMELVGLNPEHYNRFPRSSRAVSDSASVWRGRSPCIQS
jgi:ABC-type glutathione transport system ATPase component